MLQTRQYVKRQIEQHYASQKVLTGALLVIAHFRIPAPLSQPERRRKPQHGLPHIKKPDGDNLEKFLNDALNGLVWSDDSRIAWMVRSKSITSAKQGETIVFVRELESDEMPNYQLIIADIMRHIQFEENLDETAE